MTAGLVLERAGVSLGGRSVLAEVSVHLAPGRLVAVVGPNGAGKTSLLRAVMGLVPHEGRIAFDGVDLAALAARERSRRISYLPQGHEAHWPLPARDIVALGRFPFGATDPTRLSAEDERRVEEAMQLTETSAFADRPVTALSGGERARVALARVFAAGAPVILADEPTAALDPRHQIDVMRALRSRAGSGALVLAVTHDLGLAARFADEILVLAGGRLRAQGAPGVALAPDVVVEVFGVSAFRGEHEGREVIVPWG